MPFLTWNRFADQPNAPPRKYRQQRDVFADVDIPGLLKGRLAILNSGGKDQSWWLKLDADRIGVFEKLKEAQARAEDVVRRAMMGDSRQSLLVPPNKPDGCARNKVLQGFGGSLPSLTTYERGE